MERRAYELLSGMERSWWYRGRALVVTRALRRFATCGQLVLDYGAGSGGMHASLAEFGDVFAFEPDVEARAEASRRGYACVWGSDKDIAQRTYDIAAFCDVLEHVEDDRETLMHVRRSLAPGGHVVITVPAYQWMWSAHDVAHHHFRRYTKTQVGKLLESAGFEVRFASYWNALLFPLAIVLRIVGKSGEGSLGLPGVINETLRALIALEANIMRLVPLPFGLSVVAVGRRRDESVAKDDEL